MTDHVGGRIYNLAEKLFPICRSITGDGVRESLHIIDEYISQDIGLHLNIEEVPSGTQAFDWTVPKEWNIRDAYIEDEKGNKIIDFKKNNLHVMGYSAPIDKWVNLEELAEYIYTQPDQPDWIPYVTSYYKERSGFCMSENQKKSLRPGNYHLYIDSELFEGSLTYADLVIGGGRTKQEILITTYICHPSMANNECSGPALIAELIKYVAAMEDRKYNYRFVIGPETIGSITYISRNLNVLKQNVIAGINLSCVGDDRAYSVVETPYADALVDKVLKNVLSYRGEYTAYSYLERGSDERQYNAPGVDVPMVCFCRSKFGEYPEYHTSADNMDLISQAGFQGSYEVMVEVLNALEHNEIYKMSVLCEPQLGKRGLYPTISQKESYDEVRALTDFIAYANGKNDLLNIGEIIDVPFYKLIELVDELAICGLITKV